MTISIERIRESVIGERILFNTPFGDKPMVYADYTASGRALSFIEETVQNHVLPFYANTHTETSFSGKQTGKYREQARAEIHKALNTAAKHKVIFTGAGATAAINKLIEMLNLRLPHELNTQYQFEAQIEESQRPVVFIGPYEHHSNELPWRESIATLVVVPLTPEGQINTDFLEKKLQEYQSRPVLIGSFSAASNVTGVKTEVAKVSALLQRYNAMSCWDYAAAAPYVEIDMQRDQLDAVFISTHKFIGGPGTPGLLIVNSEKLHNAIPAVPGGGTVVYVSPESHTYTDDVERREEGGTPGIVESIRAGLVFKLQQQIGTKKIEALEHHFISNAITELTKQPNFELLGCPDAPRLSIMSFNIIHQKSVLHYGFVVAILNDVFGIQARGGCSCAGPYGHQLLDLSMEKSMAIEDQLHQGNMILRPGWVRLNFNYFIDQQTFDYMVKAISLIAEFGWRLLSEYEMNQHNGTWQYRGGLDINTLTLDDLLGETALLKPKQISSSDLARYLKQGEAILLNAAGITELPPATLSPEAEKLRWFALSQ
ncbi:MAG: aminotransferase class V-fold PLP-dependent enzyme [Oceanospirillaceae bacterium]|nr:aminotransferase class V-fold PLP-dependent enzyme [Oceanospirillaceae bacterium]